MEKLQLEFEVAHNTLKDSIGKHYRIYSSSLTGGTDFSINSGIITDVGLDPIEDLLLIQLDYSPYYTERFTLNRLKEIKIEEKEAYTMLQPIYNDGSYFKIYITEKGND